MHWCELWDGGERGETIVYGHDAPRGLTLTSHAIGKDYKLLLQSEPSSLSLSPSEYVLMFHLEISWWNDVTFRQGLTPDVVMEDICPLIYSQVFTLDI